MKTMLAVGVWLVLGPAAASAQGPRLQLEHLDRLSSQATESVNVTLDPAMLKMASGLVTGADQGAVKDVINGLKGIYVRTLEFAKEKVYSAEDVSTIRKQLTAPGWVRLVSVDDKKGQELVEIYSWKEGDASGGLAILVVEPLELTVVNLVGSIDLAKLGALQGNLGIPQLPIGQPSTPPRSAGR